MVIPEIVVVAVVLAAIVVVLVGPKNQHETSLRVITIKCPKTRTTYYYTHRSPLRTFITSTKY